MPMYYGTKYSMRDVPKSLGGEKDDFAMTDIIDRLRSWRDPDDFVPSVEMQDAANEIERLRAALEIIAGRRQCTDAKMSNVEVAVACLSLTPREN